MNQKIIVIDGKTYHSVDEMPEDVRRNYESALRNFDKNQNGTPDLFENKNPFADQNKNGVPDAFEGLASFQGSTTNVTSATKIIVNGQVYDSLEQLPPDVRAKYEQAMGALDANKNGIPDFVEGMFMTPNQANNIATNFGTANLQPAARNPFDGAIGATQDKPIPVNSTIEPESSGGWMLALAGIILVGLCLAAAAGVWYFFLK